MPTKKKQHIVQVPLSGVEFKRFRLIAEKEGVRFASTLARRLILGYMIEVNKR